MKIKNFSYSLIVAILLFMLIAMASVTVLLFMQYRFFKEQAERMLILQNDYQGYLSSLKQLIQEKKKELDEDALSQNVEELPDVHAKVTLKPVNREALYLKKAAVGFGKSHNLEKVVKPLYENGIWETNNSSIIRSCLTTKKESSAASKKLAKTNTPPRLYDFSLSWPIAKKQFWISSYFGPRKKSFHYGIDMAALKGTPVYAAAEGTITEVSYTPKGYGKSIVITHKKCKTRYAHLNDIFVRGGQKVKLSQQIGCVGATGLVRGKHDASHLHFEVIDLFGKRINPLYILSKLL